MSEYSLKCCICGKFVPYGADNSTDFGSCIDIEPPETDYYCNNCAKKQIAIYTKRKYIPTCWIPAKWHNIVKENILKKRG